MISVNDFQIAKPKAYWVSSNNPTVNTAQEIVAPAANTKGVILYFGSVYEFNSASTAAPLGVILAKTSVPASSVDGDVYIGCDDFQLNVSSFGKMNQPVFIPSGKGVYHIVSAIAPTFGRRHLAYSIL